MPRFRVLAQWAVTGHYYVEAESAEAAIGKVEADPAGYPLPSTTSMVDASWFIHEEQTEEFDNG